MIKDIYLYTKQFLLEFQETGTIFPSSQFAAKVLTNPLRDGGSSRKILEVGPATGCITVRILQDMLDGDELTICEINPHFMKALKKKLAENAYFIKHQARIKFFEGPIQDLPEVDIFDVIVCAIPFLNFDLSTVEEIFLKLQKMSHSKTVMTYFEYIGLRSLGMVMSSPERKKRLHALDEFFSKMYRKHQVQREPVWMNFLPIYIYTLRLAG